MSPIALADLRFTRIAKRAKAESDQKMSARFHSTTRSAHARKDYVIRTRLPERRPFLRSAWQTFMYTRRMKTIERSVIPVSRDTAARFAALTEEQKRVVRMRVAIEVARLAQRSRAGAAAEFRASASAIGNRARRKGLSLAKLKRVVDASR